MQTRRFCVDAAALATAVVVFSAPIGAQRAPDRVTVPLVVVNHRPYVDAALRKPDGTTRIARFLLDTGGGGFILGEPLARELGLTWSETSREEGIEFGSPGRAPDVSLGGFPLRLSPDRVLVEVGRSNVAPKAAGAEAEGIIPGHVLAQYHVVFDYPARALTLAAAGVLDPSGDASAMPVKPNTGFPRTEIVVDGRTYGMLLDTGASFTMVSEVVLRQWGAAHPDWKRYPGAYGDAATLGGQTLETMFLPQAHWRGQALTDMGVVSQREGVFEKYMSQMMAAPIVGSLAGNVLEHFRVDLDYAHQKLYLTGPR